MANQETKGELPRLPDFAKVTASASGLALVLSVLYDFCFINAVGLSFAEVPTTISDHVRSAIIWAPLILGVVLVGLLQGLAYAWAGIGAKTPSDAPPLRRRLDVAERVLLRYVVPASALLPASTVGTSYFFFGVFALVAWGSAADVILSWMSRTFGSRNVALACYLLPIITMLVCLFGHWKGTELREGAGDKWVLTVKDQTGTKTVVSRGIRRFSESVVLVEADRRARVLPASELISASRVDAVPRAVRASCELVGVFCTPLFGEREQAKPVPAASSAPSAAPSSQRAASR